MDFIPTDGNVQIRSLAKRREKTNGDTLEPERKDQLICDQGGMFQEFIIGEVLNDDDEFRQGGWVREYRLNRREPDRQRSQPFLRAAFQEVRDRSLIGIK